MTPINRVLVGDAATMLRRLPAATTDTVVTSPPYFRLRNYQAEGQLGLEGRVDQWVEQLRIVMSEVRRVLVPTGTLWLNLGDCYSTGNEGAPRKSLLLAPERLAQSLVTDGWILRNKIIWAKRNPMPSPTRDRLAPSWEVIYLFVKQPRYFFDLDAVRVPHKTRPKSSSSKRAWSVPPAWRVTPASNGGLDALGAAGRVGHPLGKNPGDVWWLSTGAYRGPHHAVFPPALVERPILAGSPERRCSRCRRPWTRAGFRTLGALAVRGEISPSCTCAAAWEPGLVLDPFMGSGTTGLVAKRLHRNWLGIELNPAFAALARQRIEKEPCVGNTERRRAA